MGALFHPFFSRVPLPNHACCGMLVSPDRRAAPPCHNKDEVSAMSTCTQLIHTLKNGGYDPALAALYAMEDADLLKEAREYLLKSNGGGYKCPMPADLKPTL